VEKKKKGGGNFASELKGYLHIEHSHPSIGGGRGARATGERAHHSSKWFRKNWFVGRLIMLLFSEGAPPVREIAQEEEDE